MKGQAKKGLKKKFGLVELWYVEPYWFKGMYFETEIRINKQFNLGL